MAGRIGGGSTNDVFGGLRRRVCVFAAAGGPLFAAYVIANYPTLVGVSVGVPLAAAGGFAIGSLVAAVRTRAVERAWIAVGLLVLAVGLLVVLGLVGVLERR